MPRGFPLPHCLRVWLPPALLLVSGCRASVEAYADSPAASQATAREVSASFERRFTAPVRDAFYDYARARIARYALAPSKVERDTIWTSVRGNRRELTARGRLVDGRYRFSSADIVSMPSAVGESRHYVALETLADGDRRWLTQVDQALGCVTPSAVGRVFTALLRSAERDPASIRRDYASTLPAATQVFGRLSTLDTVRTTLHPDGSTSVTLGMQLHPDALADSLPRLSAYLRKYVSPSWFRIVLQDPHVDQLTEPLPQGDARAIWFVIEGDDDLIQLHFRSRDGRLQPFSGGARTRPDTLQIEVAAYAKFGIFTVGVSELRGRFVFLRGADEVGWAMRFTEEPHWHLPPVAGLFVKSALMHPFRDEGVQFRLSVRQLGNGQSVLHRTSSVVVHESTVMRWLGNLGFTAMSDFAGRVEQEEAAFLRDGMRAMQGDLAGLPPG